MISQQYGYGRHSSSYAKFKAVMLSVNLKVITKDRKRYKTGRAMMVARPILWGQPINHQAEATVSKAWPLLISQGNYYYSFICCSAIFLQVHDVPWTPHGGESYRANLGAIILNLGIWHMKTMGLDAAVIAAEICIYRDAYFHTLAI